MTIREDLCRTHLAPGTVLGQTKPEPDVAVLDGGSIFVLTMVSDEAQRWAKDNIEAGDFNPDFPRRIVVEPRYLRELLDGIADDGLTVEAA